MKLMAWSNLACPILVNKEEELIMGFYEAPSSAKYARKGIFR